MVRVCGSVVNEETVAHPHSAASSNATATFHLRRHSLPVNVFATLCSACVASGDETCLWCVCCCVNFVYEHQTSSCVGRQVMLGNMCAGFQHPSARGNSLTRVGNNQTELGMESRSITQQLKGETVWCENNWGRSLFASGCFHGDPGHMLTDARCLRSVFCCVGRSCTC